MACQAILWTSTGLLSITPLGTNQIDFTDEITYENDIYKNIGHFVLPSMCWYKTQGMI